MTLRLARRYDAGVGAWGSAAVFLGQALAFGWAAAADQDRTLMVAALGLTWGLFSLALIDARALRLPDVLTLPLMVAGLAVAALLPGRPVLEHLVGAAAGWGTLRLLAEAYRRGRGVNGLGLGDAKLLGAAGAWLGWRPLPAVVLVACGLAFAGVGVRAAWRGRRTLTDRIAFGVPLCLAVWAAWIVGRPAP